jgi:hypothetical protein
MTTVTAATWIDAPPAAVWAVLTDLSRYREWNPLFPEAAGTLAAGQRITLRSVPDDGRPATIRPRVTALIPEAELRWSGRLPGLIAGEYTLTLKPGNGGTLVLQSETFRGFMVRFSGRTLDRAEAGFQALNSALKARVEKADGSTGQETKYSRGAEAERSPANGAGRGPANGAEDRPLGAQPQRPELVAPSDRNPVIDGYSRV